jgi:hypothetical protein
LTSHGFDFDLAFSLDETTAMAFSIIVSEQQSGVTFNWHTKEFVRKE